MLTRARNLLLKGYLSWKKGYQFNCSFRYKVLRHHPDKRRALGEDIREDDDYFTCITKVSNGR